MQAGLHSIGYLSPRRTSRDVELVTWQLASIFHLLQIPKNIILLYLCVYGGGMVVVVWIILLSCIFKIHIKSSYMRRPRAPESEACQPQC